mmetsp:Transcript_5466/g.10767  ORF Transcript_5466/g.10767 Transcript_5466/m.10767 type:complete len:227 (-) Transcript_5466:75-755(-)
MLLKPLARRAILLPMPLAILLPTLTPPQPASAQSKTREGMSLFAGNKVEEAIAVYDQMIDAQPSVKPYLWQRGLALYYADRFTDGAEQFAADVAVNPNDTEEQIWHLLCMAQVKSGLAAAREAALTVGTDRRPVMRSAQALFLGKTDTSELQAFAQKGGDAEKFYADLYLGLYGEAMGDTAEARKRISQAVASRYAQVSGASDPMAELAKVHLQRRGWVGGGKAEF